MRAIVGEADRGPIFSGAIVLGSLAVLTLTVVAGSSVVEVGAGVSAVAAGVLWYRTWLQWHVLLAMLIGVILFIPIRRYTMPGALPFELEPYRLLVAFLLLGWVASLLRALVYQGPGVVANLSPVLGFLGLFSLINVLWPLWDSKRQAIHDKVAKTNVVRKV